VGDSELLIDYLYYVAIAIQFITLFVVTVKYKQFKSRFVFFFTLFIYVSCIVELIGLYYLKVIEEHSNEVYNIYTFFEFNLVALIYYSIIKESKSLKLIIILSVLFNLIYAISFFYQPLESYTAIIQAPIVAVFFIIYLRELLNSNKILNYRKHLPFWLTAGFMIFYLSSIPFQFIRETMDNRGMFYIQMFLIYIMHSCFIYGLLWSKEETKY
jgi:hypothetical protein